MPGPSGRPRVEEWDGRAGVPYDSRRLPPRKMLPKRVEGGVVKGRRSGEFRLPAPSAKVPSLGVVESRGVVLAGWSRPLMRGSDGESTGKGLPSKSIRSQGRSRSKKMFSQPLQ